MRGRPEQLRHRPADDPLGHVVGHLAPGRPSWKVILGCPDWALAMPAERGIVFGMVLDGTAWAACGEDVSLGRGDYLLLVSPAAWRLGAGCPTAARPFGRLDAGTGVVRVSAGDGVRILAGHFEADPDASDLLRQLLPALVHVPADDPSGGRLGALLAMIGEESAGTADASDAVVRRLIEMMLIEALRARSRFPDGAGTGVLAGLADPRLSRALRAMHADLGRPWTVGQLAQLAGMSRSSLAEQFTRRVGLPPMTYLSGWRLASARQELRNTARPIATIAAAAGYGSVSAFSNAFRSAMGVGPASYRARASQARASR